MTITAINPLGVQILLSPCGICGSLWAGTFGHSPTGDPADTQAHKDALAKRERTTK